MNDIACSRSQGQSTLMHALRRVCQLGLIEEEEDGCRREEVVKA